MNNPVVITGVPSHNGGQPGIVRVRNVRPNSFDIRFEEWSYLDSSHALESIAYLVMEGSIPLDVSVLCDTKTSDLKLGKDIIVIDNCTKNVTPQYEVQSTFLGNTYPINILLLLYLLKSNFIGIIYYTYKIILHLQIFVYNQVLYFILNIINQFQN